MAALLTLTLLTAPLAALVLFWRERCRLDLREAFVLAAVVWAAYSVVAVTLLSLGAGADLFAPRSGHLARGGLLIFWAPPLVVSLWWFWHARATLAAAPRAAAGLWHAAGTRARVVATITALSVALVGLVAIAAAPNNWDSMTYHLARVAAWLQLGGMRDYATSIEPQLYQPPGAEILIAQFQALAGSDRLAALVQWFCFGGCMLVASLAAARLGAGRFGQLLAAFLVASTPMALMQGSSTQNDLVVAFWLLAAATLALGDRDGRAGDIRFAGGCLALGLAVLTKGTALIFGAPVGALLLGLRLRDRRGVRDVAIALAALLLIVLPSIPHWHQNKQVFGDYLSVGSAGNIYRNSSPGPSTIFSNLVRNTTLNLNLPGSAPNRQIESGARKLLDATGINPDDPGTTFGARPFAVGKFGPHEDHAGNLALLILCIWTGLAVLLSGAFRSRRRLAWTAVAAAQVLLFCALLRWQVWNARLHLPVFVLMAPLVAAYLASWRRQAWVTAAIVLIAIPLPLYWFYNYTRPLVGERSILTTSRDAQYFTPRPNIEGAYRQAIGAVNRAGAGSLGVAVGIDDWTYPFWPLRADPKMPVGEVLVANPSRRYASAARPRFVICVNCALDREAALTAGGYRRVTLPPAPVRHDSHLTEVPAAVALWRRGPAAQAAASVNATP